MAVDLRKPKHRAQRDVSAVESLLVAAQEIRDEAWFDKMMRDGGAATVRRLDRENSTLTLNRADAQHLDPALLKAFLEEHNLTLFLED